MKVLHVLHHSLPYVDGYAVRSRYIVDFQRMLGLTPLVVTSAQHEIEVGRLDHQAPADEMIDGVTYVRTPLPKTRLRLPFVREAVLMRALQRTLTRVIDRERIDVVHAHSPVLCGIPALRAATRNRIPVVYEVRAFWEDALLEQAQPPWHAPAMHWCGKTVETALFKRVQAVVAISQHMVDDIGSRGIGREKVFSVPNGVDSSAFVARRGDEALLRSLGLCGKAVIGFIGSFYRFEGLMCLLDSMTEVLHDVPDARLVLVGSGEDSDRISRRVAELNLQPQVLLVGRVPHEDIVRYYSIMDVLVYPRFRNRTTELVTPLKPLEAMAMGKPVVGSDVGGIRELFGDGQTGLLFEAGNSHALARKLVELLRDPALRERLGAAGREYVVRDRSWKQLVASYEGIYAQAAQSVAT